MEERDLMTVNTHEDSVFVGSNNQIYTPKQQIEFCNMLIKKR